MATVDTGTIVAVETLSASTPQVGFLAAAVATETLSASTPQTDWVVDTGPIKAVETPSVAFAPPAPFVDTGPVKAVETPTVSHPGSVLILPPKVPLQPFPRISCLVQVLQLADPRAAANPNIWSLSYRSGWNKSQPFSPASHQPTSDPNDPCFDWRFTDSCFDQAEYNNKRVWLRYLVQQGSCPGWCRQNVQAYVDTTGQFWNIWWDPNYIAYLIAFIQAVAKRYGSRKSLAVFSANAHAGGTGDWAMPTVAPSTKANGAANWTLAQAWNCPDYGQSVTVIPAPNQNIYKNWVVRVPNFGWFLVTAVSGPNTNPFSVTLQNLGYTGNAHSGTVATNAIMRVSDIEQLTSPYFNYTTQKVVDAMVQVFKATVAAFPPGVIMSQETGRNGTVDPQPQQGVSWTFNASTQIVQAGYANTPAGRWCMSMDHLHGTTPEPQDAIAREGTTPFYLLSQPVYGSRNTSGTTGIIPKGALIHCQFNWGCWDKTGLYTADSTRSAQGGAWAANGGVPFSNPLPVFQASMRIAQLTGYKLVEAYHNDILAGLLDATVPLDPLTVPPYTGQDQNETINAQPPPPGWEDGPRCSAYLPGGQTETGLAPVPPPIKLTDIFSAQQTWPL